MNSRGPTIQTPAEVSVALDRQQEQRWRTMTDAWSQSGLVMIGSPSGYNKTRFAQALIDAAWVRNRECAYVSVQTLPRNPVALLQAIATALVLPPSQALPRALARAAGQEDAGPEMLLAAQEHLRHPALVGHLLILDDTDDLTPEMSNAMATVLLGMTGSITPRVVLCGRDPRLKLQRPGGLCCLNWLHGRLRAGVV